MIRHQINKRASANIYEKFALQHRVMLRNSHLFVNLYHPDEPGITEIIPIIVLLLIVTFKIIFKLYRFFTV